MERYCNDKQGADDSAPGKVGRLETEKISDTIEDMIEFFRQCEIGYQEAFETVGTEDKRVQDLLHMIEFEPSGKERNKLATRLRDSRVTRRQSKNLVELLEPIYEFVNDSRNIKTLNLLKETLGAVRKVEQRQENRAYYPRVEGDVIRD